MAYPKADSFLLCDTEDGLQAVVAIISQHNKLILDCEGRDLGDEGGALSLISIRTVPPSTPLTAIIDAVALSKDKLRPIFDLLESPTIVKIMFDGRMDWCCLYHDYGVTIRNVLDMQLADVRARQIEGENELSGLGKCIKDHKIAAPLEISVDHKRWMNRPLSNTYLSYAALDVRLIGLVYALFNSKAYIDGQLGEQSSRYVELWKGGRPSRSDPHKCHGLLPLEILHVNQYVPTKPCQKCGRQLSEASFGSTGWTLAEKRHCWVCRAIDVRLGARGRR